jgi:hypothetical protein
MNRDKVFFALLIVSWAMRAQAGQPVDKASPKIGDEKEPTTCIWIATFKCVDSYKGHGMRGTWGLLGTPLSKDTTTEASLTFTEKKDLRDAKLSLSFQSGQWSFHARNLRYIPPDGGVVRVGGDIVRTGKIDPNGDIFRDADLTLSKDGSTATFSVGIDSASAALKFPVTYPALEMKNIMNVIVSPTKKQKETWEACLMSGWVDVPLPVAQEGSAGADASATRRVDFVKGLSGLRDPSDVNYAEWTVTRTCQQPPKLAHDPNAWPSGARPQPPMPANPTPTPQSPNLWDDWVHTAIEGILTLGGKSPR